MQDICFRMVMWMLPLSLLVTTLSAQSLPDGCSLHPDSPDLLCDRVDLTSMLSQRLLESVAPQVGIRILVDILLAVVTILVIYLHIC